MEVAKLRARLETELADEPVASGAVGLERISLAAAAVQRQHPLSVEPLAQRVVCDQGVELGERLGVTAMPQVDLDGGLEGAQPKLVEAPDLGRGERLVRNVGERRSPPQPHRRRGRRRRGVRARSARRRRRPAPPAARRHAGA